MKNTYSAPRSPHGLIQENYPGDAYKILVCCQLLNQTSIKQVNKIIDVFFNSWPTAYDLSEADEEKLVATLRPLGFYNKRTKSLKRFARDFISKKWKQPIELYGCGKYANDAWLMFIMGDFENVNPDDHALNHYYGWYHQGGKEIARRT